MEQPLARAAREKRLDRIGDILFLVFFIIGLTSAFGYIHPIIGLASIYCASITGYYTKSQNQKLTEFQREYLDEQDNSTQRAINRIEKWHTHIYYAVISITAWIIMSASTYGYYNNLVARLVISIQPQYKWMILHKPEAATKLFGLSCLFFGWLIVSLIIRYSAGNYYQQWRRYYTNGRSNNKIKVNNAWYALAGLTCIVWTVMQSNNFTIVAKNGIVNSELWSLTSRFYPWDEINKYDPDGPHITLETTKGDVIGFVPDEVNVRNIEQFISDKTGLEPYNDQ